MGIFSLAFLIIIARAIFHPSIFVSCILSDTSDFAQEYFMDEGDSIIMLDTLRQFDKKQDEKQDQKR
jgi:hypothetical protein